MSYKFGQNPSTGSEDSRDKKLHRGSALNNTQILTDFSLTVKAVTLKFIAGRDSAISSAKQGKSGYIYNLVVSLKEVVWAAQTCVHFMKILTVYTLNSHLLTLIAHNHKMYVFIVHLNILSFIDKQCGPRSDCSCRSSLIWVHNVCLYAYVK